VCVCVCVWGRRTLNCTPTGCAWQQLLRQQSMCVQCLLLLLQSCESQLLLLLLLSVCVCVCLSHRRNDTSHAAAVVSVDVDSSCDERRDKIHRQTDRYSSCSSLQICYTPLPSSRGRICMYQPWRKKETRLIFFHHLQPK
jgi:hypothetical protein